MKKIWKPNLFLFNGKRYCEQVTRKETKQILLSGKQLNSQTLAVYGSTKLEVYQAWKNFKGHLNWARNI